MAGINGKISRQKAVTNLIRTIRGRDLLSIKPQHLTLIASSSQDTISLNAIYFVFLQNQKLIYVTTRTTNRIRNRKSK